MSPVLESMHFAELIVSTTDIYDQVAKESKDSGASTHQLHQDPHKAAVQAHGANPGPVIAENLGQPASKEELRKRAEELNKK